MDFLGSIPFSYRWILKQAIGSDVKTILDLGCGEGDLMFDLSKNKKWKITGIELFQDALQKARSKHIYSAIIKSSVLKLPRKIKNSKFDIVFQSQVIEHLNKREGEKMLPIWENMAKKCVVISTPVGFIKFIPIEKKTVKNPLQKHKSGWTPSEFRERGYVVRGQGARFVYGENGLARRFPLALPAWEVLAFIFSPIVYFFPNLALYMVAWKSNK